MIKYGFFNSVNGDRTYDADDISNYFLKLISNGVFATPSNSMQVQAKSAMTVAVSAGWGFINCKWVKTDAETLLTLDNADASNPRIDRVVIGLDYTNRNIDLYVLKGTPAASPTAPTLTRTEGVKWELCLAEIAVGANVTSISQANITDTRGDTDLCGYVTGLIDQIDTTNLFAQFTAAFNAWFGQLTETLSYNARAVQRTSVYTTTQSSESVIPIGIPDFNITSDILNVYINGLRIMPNTDYSVGTTSITLTKPLTTIGTKVLFDCISTVGDMGNAQMSGLPMYNFVGSITSLRGRGNFTEEDN